MKLFFKIPGQGLTNAHRNGIKKKKIGLRPNVQCIYIYINQ